MLVYHANLDVVNKLSRQHKRKVKQDIIMSTELLKYAISELKISINHNDNL